MTEKSMSNDDKARLLDSDGENRAVRCFLGMYQCGPKYLTVKLMKIHLEHSGFNGCWPEWVNDPANAGHLTKGGAQDWLRHLFGLEVALASRREQDEWQPIETAPKDGTTILVWFRQHGCMSVSWTDREGNSDGEYAHWHIDDHKHGPYPVRGYISGDDTHWRPLPAPPASHASDLGREG